MLSVSTSPQRTQRLTVLGGGAVGKSALTAQFVCGIFPTEHDPTIEASYRKDLEVDGECVRLQVLDTAGQEEFVSMRPMSIRNGDAFIVVFSVTDRASFEGVRAACREVERVKETDEDEDFSSWPPPFVLVANKIDLVDLRVVSRDEAAALAKELGAKLVETSARVGTNVYEAFSCASRLLTRRRQQILKKQQRSHRSTEKQISGSSGRDPPVPPSSCSCALL